MPQTLVGAASFNNLTFASATSIALDFSSNYVVAGTMIMTGAVGVLIDLASNSAGGQSILRLSGTQDVSYVDALDIDSSGGEEVLNSNGKISNTVNWSTPSDATDTDSYILIV